MKPSCPLGKVTRAFHQQAAAAPCCGVCPGTSLPDGKRESGPAAPKGSQPRTHGRGQPRRTVVPDRGSETPGTQGPPSLPAPCLAPKCASQETGGCRPHCLCCHSWSRWPAHSRRPTTRATGPKAHLTLGFIVRFDFALSLKCPLTFPLWNALHTHTHTHTHTPVLPRPTPGLLTG